MPRTIADALRIAARDPDFAHDFVTNTEDYRQLYRLTDAQVREIQNTSVQDALSHLRAPARGTSGGGDYY